MNGDKTQMKIEDKFVLVAVVLLVVLIFAWAIMMSSTTHWYVQDHKQDRVFSSETGEWHRCNAIVCDENSYGYKTRICEVCQEPKN